MNEILPNEIRQINQQLDPMTVLQKMGFGGEAIYEEDEQIRIYCPIHHDIVRRSLVIVREANTFHCQHKQCPAHEGGDLIQLYAMHFGVDVGEAVSHLESGPKDLSQMIAEADRLIDRGELSSAIPVLKKILEEEPKNEINRCKMAALYLELGDKDGGFKEYLRAAEDFAVRGELDKTVNIYKLLIMITPDDLKVRRNMFYIFKRLERVDEAIDQLKFVADQLMDRKNYEVAHRVAKEMLDLSPTDPSLREFMAKLLAAEGDQVAASTEAEVAAKLYFETGKNLQARDVIEFGLKLTPNNQVLKNLQMELDQVRAKSVEVSSEGGTGEMSEDEFSSWLLGIEEQICEDSVSTESGQPVSEDERLEMFKKQIRNLDESKIHRMLDHLRRMLANVQSTYQNGQMSYREMQVVSDYYNTWCEALQQVHGS